MKLFGKYPIHLHSIAVHFTNGLYPIAVFFLFLYLILRNDSFLYTYFYVLVMATLLTPATYLTGIYDWQTKYKGANAPIFILKSRYGLVLMAVGIVCAFWYGFSPEVAKGNGLLTYLFYLVNFTIVPLTVYLGYLGGKLAFPGE